MTTRTRWLLAALTVAALAPRASAHEVDCSKLAAIAITDASGAPILDPTGLPSLAAPPAAALTVSSYPAVVAFDVRIQNLATVPSVLSSVADTPATDPSRVRSFGDTLAGTIPVGGALHRVSTVAVASYADCLAAFPVDATAGAPVCGVARDDVLTVTTDSDIAACRARVRCAPAVGPPPPPPPPQGTCTVPTWRPVLQLPPPSSVTVGHGLALGCDGSTWASATSTVLTAPQELPGALFRFDAAGVLSGTLRGDDLLATIAPDLTGDLVAVVASGAGSFVQAFPMSAPLSVRKYDASLAVRWDSPLPGTPPDLGASVVTDGASDVLVGYLRVNAQQLAHLAVRKLSPDGALLWDVELARSTSATLHAAADGGVFVAGLEGSLASQTPAYTAPQAIYLAHLDAAGNLLWTRDLPLPARTILGAVTVAPNGFVAATGTTDSPIDGGAPLAAPQAFVAEWDSAGNLVWVRVLRPIPAAGLAAGAAGTLAGAAVFDASGAVWIAGDVDFGTLDPAQPAGLTAVPYVARFDAAGTMLWVRQFPLGDTGGASPIGLRIDPGGSGVVMIFIHESLSLQWTWLERIAPDGT